MHRVLEAFVAAVTSAAAARSPPRTDGEDGQGAMERWSAAATGGWYSLSTDSCMTDILIYVNGDGGGAKRVRRPQEGTKGITKLRYHNE